MPARSAAEIKRAKLSGRVRALLALCRREAQHQPAQALARAHEAADLAREAHDDDLLSEAMTLVGELHHALGDHAQALAAYLEAVALCAPGRERRQADIWRAAARSQLGMANFREALEYLELSLRLTREAGNRADEVAVLEQIAAVYQELGDDERALAYHQSHLQVRHELGDQRGLGQTHLHIGALQLRRARQAPHDRALYLEAGKSLELAAHCGQQLGDDGLFAEALLWLGAAYLGLGYPEPAADAARRALTRAGQLGDRRLEALGAGVLGQVALTRGEAAPAAELFARALHLGEQVGAPASMQAELHVHLSRAFENLGDWRAALLHHRRWHDLSAARHSEASKLSTLAVAARLDLRRTRTEAEQQRARNEELRALVAERTTQLDAAQVEMLDLLAGAAEFRDAPLGPHVRWVAETAALLAREVGLETERARDLGLAARLHDIGKIGIADGILFKRGQLDAAEWTVMRGHTTLGARMLARGHSPLLRLAGEIALTHHERWDGGGYPAGLSGEAIPLSGRIVSVVDAFDALISERPYKQPWTLPEALAFVQEQAGKMFDPQVVVAFVRLSARAELPVREDGE